MPFEFARAGRYAVQVRSGAIGALLAVGATQAVAVDLKTIEGGDPKVTTISISGALDAGDSLKVRAFIGNLDQSRPIVAELTVRGGLYLEARTIGKFIYQAKIRTVAPGNNQQCNGPCLLVLLAGRDPDTDEPSFVKYSTGKINLSNTSLKFEERQYTSDEYLRQVANTQNLFKETADYLMSVKARPMVLHQFFVLLPGTTSQFRELTNDDALNLGIPVFDEATKQLIKPLPSRR